ncbi:hypothetical protein BDR22DRAFT_169439 [Usnea florida]
MGKSRTPRVNRKGCGSADHRSSASPKNKNTPLTHSLTHPPHTSQNSSSSLDTSYLLLVIYIYIYIPHNETISQKSAGPVDQIQVQITSPQNQLNSTTVKKNPENSNSHKQRRQECRAPLRLISISISIPLPTPHSTRNNTPVSHPFPLAEMK